MLRWLHDSIIGFFACCLAIGFAVLWTVRSVVRAVCAEPADRFASLSYDTTTDPRVSQCSTVDRGNTDEPVAISRGETEDEVEIIEALAARSRNFEGSVKKRPSDKQRSAETMAETPVSFVVGEPDPCEELENEDSFPSEGNDASQQQPPVVEGLVERRRRLR